MNFDINISDQSEEIVSTMQAVFYKKLSIASSKTKWMHLSGLGVGIVSGCLQIAMRVAAIVENTFKGCLNILSGQISTGINQIVCQNLRQIILLPFSLLSETCNVIKATVSMALDPNKYTAERWFDFDPEEKQRQEVRAQRMLFDRTHSLLQQDPKNVTALKMTANYFKEGIIVQKNELTALGYYERAAACGDVDSMCVAGLSYYEGKIIARNDDMAFSWFEMAAHKGNANAMAYLGLCYENPLTRNIELALSWHLKAAKNGSVSAMLLYAVKHARGLGVAKDLVTAVYWFRKAASHGDVTSNAFLSSILRQHPAYGAPEEWWVWYQKASCLPHPDNARISLEKF